MKELRSAIKEAVPQADVEGLLSVKGLSGLNKA